MENKTTAMQQFEQYATDRLNNHIAELDTRYENEEIDKETLEKAYTEHKELFSQELDEKIKELGSGQNEQGLQSELQNQKHNYINQLNLNQNKS